MNSSSQDTQDLSIINNLGNDQISNSNTFFQFGSGQTNNQSDLINNQYNNLSNNNYYLGLDFTTNNNTNNNNNNFNSNFTSFNSQLLERQNSNLYFNNFQNYDNFNCITDHQQQQYQQDLELFSYQIQVNAENSKDEFDQMFEIDNNDQGQQYADQHLIRNNQYRPNIQNMIYFPLDQTIGQTQTKLVNIVLINENNNAQYAFDQIPIPITEDKQYDINSIIELQLVRAYIDDSTIVSIKKKDMNIFLGTFPIRKNRLQYIEDGLIQILFKNENKNDRNSNNYNSSNSNNNESEEDKRMLERTIKEAFQLVKCWRDTMLEANKRRAKNYKKISLESVAHEAKKCKKKTLDYYFLELRKAEQYDFNFAERLNEKMGQLRQFNLEMKERLGDKKPGKDLEFQLPEEDVLPLDQELINRLVQNAQPSSRNNRGGMSRGGRYNAAQQDDFDDDDENEEENSNENKNNFQPLPKTKPISKQKSDSPKTQILEKPPLKVIHQQNDSDEEEENKFDGSNQQRQQYYYKNQDQSYKSHTNTTHRFNQSQSFFNPEDISNQNHKHRIEDLNNLLNNQNRDRVQITNSNNNNLHENIKKENSIMTMSSLFGQFEKQENNLLNDSLFSKNNDNQPPLKIEDTKLFDDQSQFNIPSLNHNQSLDVFNPNYNALQ